MTPPSPAPHRTPIPHLPGIVWGLILLCLLPELVLQGADHGLWGSARWRPLAYQNGAFWAGLLYGWRPNYGLQPGSMFLTYAWLHGGLGHLAGNLLVLGWLGPLIAARMGAWGVAAVWLAATLGGAAAFGALTTSPAPMVGASGALFGLAGALIICDGRARRRAGTGLVRTTTTALGLGLGLAAFNLAAWVMLSGQLAWETHLGGALAGATVAMLWRRP